MEIIELNTKQILKIRFKKAKTLQDIIKFMLQTAHSTPEDYPIAELSFAGKKIKAWLVGYKETGNRVFVLKNGTLVTAEMKRIRETTPIIWRLRLKAD